jgi:hypothetical protein
MIVNETQDFRGTFLMYAIILLEFPTLILLAVLWQTGKLGDEGPIIMGVVFGIMFLVFTLLMNIKLEVRMTPDGFSYRNPPFINKWKKISPEEMESIKVKKMDGLLEYGGVGLRFAKKTKAFIFFADHVLEVQLPNKKLVFSTKKPKEMEEVISSWKENENRNREIYG